MLRIPDLTLDDASVDCIIHDEHNLPALDRTPPKGRRIHRRFHSSMSILLDFPSFDLCQRCQCRSFLWPSNFAGKPIDFFDGIKLRQLSPRPIRIHQQRNVRLGKGPQGCLLRGRVHTRRIVDNVNLIQRPLPPTFAGKVHLDPFTIHKGEGSNFFFATPRPRCCSCTRCRCLPPDLAAHLGSVTHNLHFRGVRPPAVLRRKVHPKVIPVNFTDDSRLLAIQESHAILWG